MPHRTRSRSSESDRRIRFEQRTSLRVQSEWTGPADAENSSNERRRRGHDVCATRWYVPTAHGVHACATLAALVKYLPAAQVLAVRCRFFGKKDEARAYTWGMEAAGSSVRPRLRKPRRGPCARPTTRDALPRRQRQTCCRKAVQCCCFFLLVATITVAVLALANNCRRITDLTFDVPPSPSSGGGYHRTFPDLGNGTGTAVGTPPFAVVGDF